jgi:hypothetical protein
MRAFMSLGKTVKSTRFYFADAAYQGKIRTLIPELEKFQKEFMLYLDSLMTTLRYIIEYFFAENGIATKKDRVPYHED